SPPRFVYFDLDDTLLDHSGAERDALRDLAGEVLGLRDDSPVIERLQQAYHDRNRELWTDYALGRISKDDLRRKRFEHIAADFADGHEWSDLDTFYMNRYADHWRPVAGALQLFQWVAERFPVGIITNGFASTQHAKLDRFPVIREVSRAVIISEEVGHLKPDRRLFLHAERAAGESGDSILYVGDSLRSDVEGAVAAGWRAAWYTTTETPPQLDANVFAFGSWPTFQTYLAG
ncbi:MAG: HAD-IA family hydrolase, partial [Rhodothermales bacterium]|nr:HAD-IA family hydrolase [Rhodothermales bacterium]